MGRREVDLDNLEKKYRKLQQDAESLISSFGSKSLTEGEYISRRAALEKEFAEITDRITRLRFVRERRGHSEKT